MKISNFQFPISKGFTLIELLVVISILSIIGVISFANYGNLKKDQDLKAAASDIQSLIRLAQSNSTSRLKCGNDITGSGANWIIEFKADKISVELKCQIPANPLPSPISSKTIVLGNSVTADTINGDLGCIAVFPVTITYSPLYGGVSFSDSGTPDCNNSSRLSINLKDSEGNIRTITVNKGGSVEIGEYVTGAPTSPTSTPVPSSAPTPTSPPSCVTQTPMTFTVSASADDGYVSRSGSTYPPTGSFIVDTSAPNTLYVHRHYSVTTGTSAISNALVRWDTQSLPDNAVITGASFTGYVLYQLDDNNRSLTADWYPIWPINSFDWEETARTSALSNQDITALTINSNHTFALQNAETYVSKTDYTGLRFHISGGQPSPDTGDGIQFATFDSTNPKPTLVVTYQLCSGPTPTPNPCTMGFQDFDKDGWGIGAFECYASSPGYDIATSNGDCKDNDIQVNPGATFHASQGSNGWDYNCNGTSEKQYFYRADTNVCGQQYNGSFCQGCLWGGFTASTYSCGETLPNDQYWCPSGNFHDDSAFACTPPSCESSGTVSGPMPCR